jgi:hypothetical protein
MLLRPPIYPYISFEFFFHGSSSKIPADRAASSFLYWRFTAQFPIGRASRSPLRDAVPTRRSRRWNTQAFSKGRPRIRKYAAWTTSEAAGFAATRQRRYPPRALQRAGDDHGGSWRVAEKSFDREASDVLAGLQALRFAPPLRAPAAAWTPPARDALGRLSTMTAVPTARFSSVGSTSSCRTPICMLKLVQEHTVQSPPVAARRRFARYAGSRRFASVFCFAECLRSN